MTLSDKAVHGASISKGVVVKTGYTVPSVSIQQVVVLMFLNYKVIYKGICSLESRILLKSGARIKCRSTNVSMPGTSTETLKKRNGVFVSC